MNSTDSPGFFVKEAKQSDYARVRKIMESVDLEFCPPLSKRAGGIEGRIEKSLTGKASNFLLAEYAAEPGCESPSLQIAGVIEYIKDWKKESNRMSLVAFERILASNTSKTGRRRATPISLFLQ